MVPDGEKVYFGPCAGENGSALKKSTEKENVTAKIQLKTQKSVGKFSPHGEAMPEGGGAASEWITEKFSEKQENERKKSTDLAKIN